MSLATRVRIDVIEPLRREFHVLALRHGSSVSPARLRRLCWPRVNAFPLGHYAISGGVAPLPRSDNRPLPTNQKPQSATAQVVALVLGPKERFSEKFFGVKLQSEHMFDIFLCMAKVAADSNQGATGVVDLDVVALSITDSMINVDHQLHHVPAKSALELIEFCRRRLDASESRILADRYEKGASDRDVEDMAKGSDGKTSKATAKRKARRAKATNANPDLADRLAKGDMSSCLLYTSPSPRDRTRSRMPSSA